MLTDDDVQLPVRGSREQKILATLLLNADQPVSVAHLVDAVWDDDPPPTAAIQVRNRVSRLRRSWSGAVDDPDDLLRTAGNGYLLRLAGHDLDLRNLERHVAAARAAAGAGDREGAARALRAALGHWRGPTLYGVGGEAVTAAATLLEERRLQVLEECLGHELALGRHQQLVVELAELARAHPLRERFTEHLMLALYRSGRQADALAAYHRYGRTLRDELGLDPSPDLRTLHEAVLRRSPGIGPPAGSAAAVPVPPAPPSTVDQAGVRPAEIPADVADFTGRVPELAALDALLPRLDAPPGGVPIIAITGTAGAGKTALAVHWAHRVAGRFPDGQLHVNLRGYARGTPVRPVEALAAMLRALGVDAGHVPAEPDEAARLFRSTLAGRRVLLVLDDARSAEQLRPLLPGGSGCLVLITSSNRLDGLVASHGARRLTVDPLSEDDAVELLARILGPRRVAGQREALARLARACARLPLALRIAAANLDGEPHLPLASYVDELQRGDRLAALRIVDDSPAVRTVFDASYAGLPIDTRRVFRLLGLVPGPDFAVPAVAALAGLDGARAALVVGRLAAAHLVRPSGAGRFTAHELLRLYMRQRAEAEESREQRAAAVEALLRWYLENARAAVRSLRAWPDAAAADWLDAERANLVAAIDHAAAYGPRELAWLLADALRGHL